MSITLGPSVFASAIDGSRYWLVTSLKGGKHRPEVKRTSEMSVLSDEPKFKHWAYLACQRFWSASSAALRLAATSGVAPSAVKKSCFRIEKRGSRSTTRGKVRVSGKVATSVRTSW